MINNVISWISRTLLGFSALLALLLSFLVVADVIGRVIFNSPVKGTPEIVSMSIVIICFLQASYAIRSSGMLKMDALQIALPARASAAIAAVGCLLGAAFFLVVVYGGIDPLHHAWVSNEFEGEGALRVPTWPARAAVMLGSALAATEYLLEMVQQFLIMAGKAQPARARESITGH
jgi:TRAP-type C4-dicarboxylate transport system permease small subunit